ncbi:hypothetical protein GPA27_13530 [Aromatoleum toluolicum]|uniref:Uncharacterized protein n=1 Tax=Aromatoleum toluolicum TaxID=90060 RepID=A0ABX1NGK0_9RHOO|nr:hypothetical protein [Aromatoleum toluolicum]NMF98407.1 hypothetical protein [Aromatoleum toluolicum]
MMDWFRLYGEFATDPKVQMLSEADQRRYIMLLCLKCSNGDVTLHDEEVAFQLRISGDEWSRTKGVLQAKGLIDENACPVAWDKRQFRSDSSAARVAAHRERKKKEAAGDVTLQQRQTNALDTDTDTELTNANALVVASVPAADPCPHQEIIAAYHELLPTCTPVKVWNEMRKTLLRTRWREDAKRQRMEWWRRFFAYVGQSEFLTGRGQCAPGRDPFVADLEWLVRPQNFAKVVEGKYHRDEVAA